MAGICLFTRAPHLQIEHKPLYPGEPNPNERRFDSDAKRSICMAFGYDQSTFRLELFDRGAKLDKYNVYAGSTGVKSPPIVGTLEVTIQEWQR